MLNQRKPGLPKLTKQNTEDAPQDTRYFEAVKTTLNSTIEEVEKIRSEQSGIKLLQNADVEMIDVDVQVPDPWIPVTAFDNGYAENNPNNKYYKGPDGVVELHFSLIGGGADLYAFTLPVGYRPDVQLDFNSWDSNIADHAYITNAGVFVPAQICANGEPSGCVRFLASDSNPVPLSCWPKMIKTKFTKVSAVMVGGVYDAQTSEPLPAGAVHPPVWEMSTQGGFPQVKLLNIAGLPYNRKSLVRLLIFGG